MSQTTLDQITATCAACPATRVSMGHGVQRAVRNVSSIDGTAAYAGRVVCLVVRLLVPKLKMYANYLMKVNLCLVALAALHSAHKNAASCTPVTS